MAMWDYLQTVPPADGPTEPWRCSKWRHLWWLLIYVQNYDNGQDLSFLILYYREISVNYELFYLGPDEICLTFVIRFCHYPPLFCPAYVAHLCARCHDDTKAGIW